MSPMLALLLATLVPAVAPGPPPPEQLVFLLEYIGSDYGAAVAQGKIADPYEYEEMVRFAELVLGQADALEARGASPAVRADLLELRELIRGLKTWDEVRATTSALVSRLVLELHVVATPVEVPDPARGATLYRASCAACHGPSGAGDGFADPAMDPPATSLRDAARMGLVSPRQVFGATSFGIEGTAMPSYLGALSSRELWDIAFHVMSLRDGFAPAPVEPEVKPALEELSAHSPTSLRETLAGRELEITPAEIDYWLAHPPRPQLPAGVAVSPPPADAVRPPLPSAGSELGVALSLQDAFSSVADRVVPSVACVSAYVRAVPPRSGARGSKEQPAWEIEGDDALYPGFQRVKTRSGFFVSADGYLLTTLDALTLPGDEKKTADVIDVELADGRHVLSRLVGAEPTIDLAVVRLEIFSELRPPVVTPIAIGAPSAAKVGHWMIASGDPWGPERTFAVGMLAAQPERQCYQDQLTGTLLQASLTVPPEAYGGPLVNIHGEVVGMTVPHPAGRDPTAARASEFALPIDLALNIYEALRVAESRRSPWLGFAVIEIAGVHRRQAGEEHRPVLSRTGVYLDNVFNPSPASRADIRVGDCLVSIDGNRLFSVLDFQKWLYLSGIGRKVHLEIFRNGETLFKDVTVEERPPEATTR